MPLPDDLKLRPLDIFNTSLALSFIVATFFFPLTGLNACAALLLYLYLYNEPLLNSSLVRHTPPVPENHLPSHDEWVANGGLKKLLPLDKPDSRLNDECCIVCRDLPNDPVQITLCGHIFCSECIDAWHALGNRS